MEITTMINTAQDLKNMEYDAQTSLIHKSERIFY